MSTIAALFVILISLGSLALFGVGIPFFITGLINTIKANRKIALFKMNNNSNNYTQQQAQENNYYAPQQDNNYYAPQANNYYAPPQPQYAPEQPPVQNYQPAPDPSAQNWQYQAQEPNQGAAYTGFIDIDWRKYNPLDAGISYNKNKDYKFHRAEGFAGSVPQTFVNRTFPKCPICCSSDPYWTISQHNQMSWKGNLYLFKCSRCEGIISMSMPDVTTLGNGGSGVAANPSVGLTNLMAKSSSGKEAGAVYAVIESVGHSGVTPECEGKEFKLEQVQEMFLRQ